MSKLIRIDKFLADMGKGSRSQIKDGTRKGKLMINGQIEKKADRKIDPVADLVTWENCQVTYTAAEYYMLYKPQGVVSATRDNLHPTVIDLLPDAQRKDLFPVGRLDIDTEGLLLITNDGDLAHHLLSPRHHIDKTYEAEISGVLPADAIEQLAQGITLLDGTVTLPALLEIQSHDQLSGRTKIALTIQEGKFHQVKRMFEALGTQVVFLKRIQMGALALDPVLLPGESRPLTETELVLLKQNG